MNIEEQGKEGESLFQKWLDSHDLGYLRVDQERSTLPKIFKDSIKRPDFLLLLPSIGFIAIDVKNYTLQKNSYTLKIDRELERAISFEHYTRIYLWYAYRSKDDEGYKKWSFISAHRAMEKGIKKRNKKKENYLEIEKKYFTEVIESSDLGGLFTSRIGVVGKFARALERSFNDI